MKKDGIYLTINKELLKSKTYFPDLHVAKIKGTTKYITSDMLYELRYFGYFIPEFYISSDTGHKKIFISKFIQKRFRYDRKL